MAAVEFNKFQIQLHDPSLLQDDEFCLICDQKGSEPPELTEKTGVALGHVWSYLEKLPRNFSLVHTSSHPEVPYHYACLRIWYNLNSTCHTCLNVQLNLNSPCPLLDKRTVHPIVTCGELKKEDYSPSIRRVMDAAARVFGEKK